MPVTHLTQQTAAELARQCTEDASTFVLADAMSKARGIVRYENNAKTKAREILFGALARSHGPGDFGRLALLMREAETAPPLDHIEQAEIWREIEHVAEELARNAEARARGE